MKPEDIERALRRRSLNPAQLAQELGLPQERVRAVLASCTKVHNLGSVELPIWTSKIGNVSSELLVEELIRLLSERPMNVSEVAAAMGISLLQGARTFKVFLGTPLRERLINLEGRHLLMPEGWEPFARK